MDSFTNDLAALVAGMIMLGVIIAIVIYCALWLLLIGGVLGVVYLLFWLCENERYDLAIGVLIAAFIVMVVVLAAR